MIACFDVYYVDDHANAAAVVANEWTDENIVDQFRLRSDEIGEYCPGSFYQRELKPLQSLLQIIDRPIGIYVIDAYCHLSADGEPGLGHYLHQSLPDDPIVVGVAKNRFRDTTHAIELCRGGSERPLFITSIGIDYQIAADHIQSMAGNHRMPMLLKMVDRLSRNGEITKR